MGKSPTLQELEKQEDEYRAYLKKIEDDLNSRATQYDAALQKSINDFYNDNKWTRQDFISGKHSDFMQQSEWSMKNVKAIIDAISQAVFGDSAPPEGVTIKKTEEVGAAITNMEAMELYVAGKCFEVLSGIVESFGSSTEVTFKSGYKSEPLGNGFHLFATVVSDSYKSTEFFKNKEIIQYLYIYEVKFSLDEAKQQAQIELTRLYEDQIATFTGKSEALLKQLETDAITGEQYESLNAIYDKLIAAAQKKLDELKAAPGPAMLVRA